MMEEGRDERLARAVLLRSLAETSNDARIRRYERAIMFYAQDLYRVWE